MQTLTDLALKVIRWERVGLQRGAYRLRGIMFVEPAALEKGYVDCTNDAQFADELSCVKQHFGLTGGVWAGMVMNAGATASIVALLLE